MGQPQSAIEYLYQNSVQKKFQAIEKATKKELKNAQTLTNGPLKAVIPSKLLSQHQADVKRLKLAQGVFGNAQTLIFLRRRHDLSDLTPAYEDYIKALNIVEAGNHRLAALLGAGVSVACAAFISIFLKADTDIKKRAKKLHGRLLKLKKELDRVKWSTYGAKAQASGHVIVAAVVLSLGPTSILARVGVDMAGLTVNNTITWLLGPKGGSGWGPIKVPSTGPAKTIGAIKPALGKLTALTNFGITVWKDMKSVKQTELNLKKVQSEIKAVTGEMNDLVAAAERMEKDLQKQRALYETAVDAFRESARKFKSSHAKREALVRELRQW